MADYPWGRIRVRHDQALLLHRLLNEERARVSVIRNAWKILEPSSSTAFNRMTALIDATQEELSRLADEKGWDLRDHRDEV